MSAFNSFSTSKRRLSLMWNLVVLLFSVAALGKAQAEDATTSTISSTVSTTSYITNYTTIEAPTFFFDLPSLSILLDVEKEGDALIPFQDQLKESMEAHLENFFTNKLLLTEVGVPALVDFDLESQILWKEHRVEPKEITTEGPDDKAFTHTVFVKKYEVKGIYNCKIKLQVTPITTEYGEEKPVHVTQSLVNMFFLEAFQGDYYWDLMHGFMTDPLLRDIISTKISVLDTGFVHPYDENGNLRFETSDRNFMNLSKFNDGEKMSPIMIMALIFIVFFFFVLVAIWIYLWIVMKDRRRFYCLNKRKIGRSRSKDDTGSFVTDSTNSQDSLDEDSNDSRDDASRSCSWASSLTANLDAWAFSVTSIPLRDVENKRRKKRGAKVVKRPYFRPSDEHSSCLEDITEADNESWCSSVRSKSGRSNRTANSRTRRYNRSQSRRADEDSFVIYEGDAEQSIDEEENVQGSPLLERQMIRVKEIAKNSPVFVQRQMMKLKEKAQNSPIMIQRQLINLVPSEDEFDHSFSEDNEILGEF